MAKTTVDEPDFDWLAVNAVALTRLYRVESIPVGGPTRSALLSNDGYLSLSLYAECRQN
jgi:hypothetical protein